MGPTVADQKFIPDADYDFARMARNFVLAVTEDPGRYFLTNADASRITAALARFREALATTLDRHVRTRARTRAKDDARAEAERVIRGYANQIRANDAIDAGAKRRACVRERPKRLRRRKCPAAPPHLSFVRADGGVHVLRFQAEAFKVGKAKPAGAARLELFAEHVPPGRAVPRTPAELCGRVWYVRSYTSSPMRVSFPMPPEPAMVVYWARWASSTGEVGRFCGTVQAGVEGWPAARAA